MIIIIIILLLLLQVQARDVYGKAISQIHRNTTRICIPSGSRKNFFLHLHYCTRAVAGHIYNSPILYLIQSTGEYKHIEHSWRGSVELIRYMGNQRMSSGDDFVLHSALRLCGQTTRAIARMPAHDQGYSLFHKTAKYLCLVPMILEQLL